MMFAKYPQLINFSERNFLNIATNNRVSDQILQSARLLSRKIFYYGNVFAGSELTFHTKALISKCEESLWKENPRIQYLYWVECFTEIYCNQTLLASSISNKVFAQPISEQSLIQDTKRLFHSLNSSEQPSIQPNKERILQ